MGVVAAAAAPAAPQIVAKPLAWFILAPQVRKNYDDDDLRRLGESMKSIGQLAPVGAKPDGILLWGHRRLLAARLVGLTTIQVIITDRQMSDSEIRLIQLSENMHRADLTGHEKWLTCSELMCMNPAWQMKDLAKYLNLDPSMVTRLLSPSKCIPAVQEALAANKITIRDCYAIAQLPEGDQQGLLNLRLAPGGKLADVEQAGRKARNPGNGAAPTVRVSRIKCQVPGKGATVVVSGEAISLEDMIEAMAELTKEAKKASERGLDAKTFERVCRDLAKKG